jgi:flagellar motor switch protein FliN/FliY
MTSAAHTWLLDQISTALAAAIGGLTGDRPTAATRALASDAGAPALRWRQTFSGISGAIWMHAADADAGAIGAAILRAAEVEETDPAKLKSEFLEIVRQALSSVARAMSLRLERETACEPGEESDAPAHGPWSAIDLQSAGLSAIVSVAIEPALANALELPEPAPKSKNYDLLLDVELPVSVSFGRAQVALKDVLKLTTGSVVELNRDIGDPVEVIVNNCVIARGEVVVVEGNFGVRIQQVISRQERLRTLK